MSSFVLSIHIFENLADAKAHTAERIRTGKLLLESWMSEHGECPPLPSPLLSSPLPYQLLTLRKQGPNRGQLHGPQAKGV